MSYNPPPLYTPVVITDSSTGLVINNPLWTNWFLSLTGTVSSITEVINVYLPPAGSSPISVNTGGGASEGVVLEGDDSVSFMYPPGSTADRTISKSGTYYLDPALTSYITWSSANGLYYKPGPTTGSNADHTWVGATGTTEATLSSGSYVVQGDITATGALKGGSGLITGNLVGQSIIQGQTLETTSGFVYLNGTATAYLSLDVTNGITYKSGQFDGTYSHVWKNAAGVVLATLAPNGTLTISGPIYGPGGNFWGKPGVDGLDGEDGAMGPPGPQGAQGTPATPGNAAYGEMTIINNAVGTVCTLQNTFYKITTGWTAGNNNGFTFSTDTLTTSVAGAFLTCAEVSVSSTSSNQVYNVQIYKNGVAIPAHNAVLKLTNSTDIDSLTATGVIDSVLAGDVFDVRISNLTSAAQTVTVQYANLSLTAIQGATGATGPMGAQGIDGIEGPEGPIGPPGINGSTGAAGAQGIQGIAGGMMLTDFDYADALSECLMYSNKADNPTLNTLKMVGAISPSTTAGLIGTTLADSANAGAIGEWQTSTGSPVTLTTGVTANILSFSLTAGDWEVRGMNSYVMTVGGIVFVYYGGTSTTSATLGPFGSYFQFQGQGSNVLAVPTFRYNISTTTTIYLVANVSFGSGTCNVTGTMQARRIR